MRVHGDVDGCRRAARELLRAAAAVAAGHSALQALLPATGLHWSGAAAGAFRHHLSTQATFVDHIGARLHEAGRRLARFADDLEVLQARCRGLVADAARAGLHLDACGWIPPLLAERASLDALHAVAAEQLRSELMARARVLRADEAALHDGLARELHALHEPLWVPPQRCGPEEISTGWSPTAADAPAFALATTDAVSRLPDVPKLVGKVAAHPVVGGLVTLGTDLAAGEEWDDAAIKVGLTTGATATALLGASAVLAPVVQAAGVAAAAVGAGAVVTAAPVVLSGAVLVAVGAGVGYAGGRIFDAYGHHLPFVDAPSKRKRRCR